MRAASETAGIGQGLRRPREERQILAAQIGVHAERDELFRRDDETGFLAQLPRGGGGETLAGLRHTLGNVPARRARRVTEQEAFAIGDDYAAARLRPAHGRI